MEGGPDEVFNDTIQDVVESMEATEPETEPGGRSAKSSKKVVIYESLNCNIYSDESVHELIQLRAQRLDAGRSEVWTRKKPSIDDTPHQVHMALRLLALKSSCDAHSCLLKWTNCGERRGWRRPGLCIGRY